MAEFVELMRRCKEASGSTYRQLEIRAAKNGDVLARSTLAGALSRAALPKADLLAAFVRACGVSEAEVAEWVAARQRLLTATSPPPGSGDASGPDSFGAEDGSGRVFVAGSGDPVIEAEAEAEARPEATAGPDVRIPPSRSRRRAVLLAAGTVTAAVLMIAAAAALNGDEDGQESGAAVPAGEVSVRPQEGPDLCLTDGMDRAGRYDSLIAVFRPCAKATPPVTELRATGDGRYRVHWYHPDHGPGCLAAREQGAPKGFLEPFDDCEKGSALRVERVTDTAATYVLMVSEGQCVAAAADGREPVSGAEAVVRPCDGSAGQRFVIRRSAGREGVASGG